MKFLKKAAALFFCLALALSVMAISASAADGDPTYTVTVAAIDTDSNEGGFDPLDTNGAKFGTNNDLTAVEWGVSSTATYGIYLAVADLPEGTTSVSVNAVEFVLSSTAATNARVSNADANRKISNVVVKANDNDTPANRTVITPNATTNKYKISTETLANSGNSSAGGSSMNTGYFTISDTPALIATIEFTTTDLNNDVLSFTLGNINVHETGTAAEYMPADVTTYLEVDPQYTITVMDPTHDASFASNGVVATDSTTHKTNAWATAHSPATYTYTILNGVTDGPIVATNYHGYKFTGFKVNADSGNWQTTDSVLANSATFGYREHYGDVTLNAEYDAIQYTLTYDDGVDDGVGSAATNMPTATSYYITDAAATAFFGTPSRTGYKFAGWLASEISASTNEYNSSSSTTEDPNVFWTATTYKDTTAVNNATNLDTVGAYGNVKLTAQWTMDGEFVQVDYKYASGSDVLTLFATQNTTAGTYSVEVDGTDTAMFKLPVAKYGKLFGKANNSDANKVSGDSWTIYAYITAVATGDTVAKKADSLILFTAGTSTNQELSDPAGDVNGNNAVNSGDYGSAGVLLKDGSSYNYTDVTVEGRLKANAGAIADADSYGSSYSIGTIADIAAIMDLAG